MKKRFFLAQIPDPGVLSWFSRFSRLALLHFSYKRSPLLNSQVRRGLYDQGEICHNAVVMDDLVGDGMLYPGKVSALILSSIE